jgi:hypothetical protein
MIALARIANSIASSAFSDGELDANQNVMNESTDLRCVQFQSDDADPWFRENAHDFQVTSGNELDANAITLF